MTTNSDTAFPPLKPVIGNLFELDREQKIASLVRLAHKYGPFYKVGGLGKYRYVATTHELINELCDEARFAKRIFQPLKEVVDSQGVTTILTSETDSEDWKQAHRILIPAFGPMAIRDMFPKMREMANQMFTRWELFGPKSVIDLEDNMMRLTFDTIAFCAFDTRLNSFYRERRHPFVEAMVDVARELDSRMTTPKIVKKLQVSRQKRFAGDWKILAGMADDIIKERLSDPKASQKKDILDRLINGVDPVTGNKLDEKTLPYQMDIFMAAGHDTTGATLAFATYFMLKNPEVMQKARAEVDAVVGEGELKLEHLSHLVYIEQIIKESLRLYPTAPVILVKPRKDTVLAGKYPLTTEDTVLLLMYALHRDPKVWDDPEVFRPERFAPENISKLPQNAWKPFGNGARACLGRPFAMQETKVAIALMLQRFELAFVDPNYKLELDDALTLKPRDVKITAKARRPGMHYFGYQATGAISANQRQFADLAPKDIDTSKTKAGATPLLVLYGSNAGTSENYARRIAADSVGQGYAVRVAPMDEYADNLPKEGALVIVTSSYNGNPAENAARFLASVEAAKPGSLAGVKYAVFGCGNRQWHDTFQAVPTRVDVALEKAGAERVIDRGLADFAGDYFESEFEDWYSSLLVKLADKLGMEAPKLDEHTMASNVIKVNFEKGLREKALRLTDLAEARVVQNRELVDLTSPDGISRHHLEIVLPEGVSYRAGDYLAVLAYNPTEVVSRVLRRFGLSYETRIHLSEAGLSFDLPEGYSISCGEFLEGYVELSQPATQSQVASLAAMTRCPPEKSGLEALADIDYQGEVLAKRLSVLDLLERFQSCPLDFGGFLGMLPPMKIRQYSISSTPLWKPDEVTLTVTLVDAPALSGQGRYLGVASSFLAGLQAGDRLSVAVQPSHESFHLPADPKTPMIMVCAGAGIAPFRGFLQQRALEKAQGQEVAKSLLFFGCRRPEVDYLYKEELEQWQQQGIVDVFTAFSRAPEGDIRYAQDAFWEHRQQVYGLFEQGAKVFVCGTADRVAQGARETFLRIYQDATGASAEQAQKWLADMERNQGRYAADIFV